MAEEMFLKMKAEQKEQDLLDNFASFSRVQAEQVLNEFTRVIKPNGVILVGDILQPGTHKNIKSITKSPVQRWWPPELNHKLSKLKIKPDFLKNYCRQKGFKCEILAQRIPGRVIPEKRYDARITVNPARERSSR